MLCQSESIAHNCETNMILLLLSYVVKQQWVQVALHELSKCLPEGQRPMPAHLVEVADNNTSALPNTGMDAGLRFCPCTHQLSFNTLPCSVYVHVCVVW